MEFALTVVVMLATTPVYSFKSVHLLHPVCLGVAHSLHSCVFIESIDGTGELSACGRRIW